MTEIDHILRNALFVVIGLIACQIPTPSLRHQALRLAEDRALGQALPEDSLQPQVLGATNESKKADATRPPVVRVTMLVGTSRTFTFAEGSDLRVSRRGIVDLYHRGRGIWDVTALHSGIVAIEASSPKGDQESTSTSRGRRLYIEVTRKDDGNTSLGRHFWTHGFCHSKGLRCDEATNSVSGTTESPMVYRLALKSCRNMTGCLFDLSLGTAGQRQLLSDLQRAMGSTYQLIAAPQFPWIVRSACDVTSLAKDREEINLRTDAAIHDGLLVLHCFGEDGASTFDLHTLIFLASGDTANEKGGTGLAQINLGLDTRYAGMVNGVAGEIRRILTDVAQERTIRIIGEPVTRLRSGSTVEVQSGGEFPFIVRGKEAAQGWKSHGLSIQASVTHLPRDWHLLSLSAALRMKESSGSNSLSLQSLKSQIEMPLDVPVLAGTIDLDTEDVSGSETPWLASLPLIGPFFRQKGESRSHSRLIIITRLTRATDAAARAPISPEIAPVLGP